jgi:hypothetical protein
MAYAVHGDVSDYMMIAAFGAGTTPTSTMITAAIVHADARIDSFIGTASIGAAVLKLASCMIVAEMIERAKRYLIQPDEVEEMRHDILTPEVISLLREGMEESGDVAIIVSNQSDYQTSTSPDNLV